LPVLAKEPKRECLTKCSGGVTAPSCPHTKTEPDEMNAQQNITELKNKKKIGKEKSEESPEKKTRS
jgi:hypothetical protein